MEELSYQVNHITSSLRSVNIQYCGETYPEVLQYKVVSSNHYQLSHLLVPDQIRSRGIGKKLLRIFYDELQNEGVQKFSIKIGGGEDSRRFLYHCGFSGKYIHTTESTSEYRDSYVIVADEVKPHRIDPAPISEFPEF